MGTYAGEEPIEEEGHADDDVREEQHGALEPVGLAVGDDARDDERGEEGDARLEEAEHQVERPARERREGQRNGGREERRRGKEEKGGGGWFGCRGRPRRV